MKILVMIGQFMAGMSLLVLVHEFGHFVAAKAFGIRVRKFYLFFDAWGLRLFRLNYKGTEYGIGWLPLGGYVKMAGMLSNHDDEERNEGSFAHRRYHNKPVWQRIIVMLSGILMNLVLAVIVFSGLTVRYGKGYMASLGQEYRLDPGKLGKLAGLEAGDRLVAVDDEPLVDEEELTSSRLIRGKTVLSVVRSKGKERVHLHIAIPPQVMQTIADEGMTDFFSVNADYKADSVLSNLNLYGTKEFKHTGIFTMSGDSIHSYEEFLIKLQENKARELFVTVIHDGQVMQLKAHRDKDGHIGFSLRSKKPAYQPQPVSVGASIATGTTRTLNAISDNAKGFGQMLSGEVKVKEALNGPVKIATMFGEHMEWKRFWSLIALLSIGIGFINILPIPALDGGQVLLVSIEGIRGKPMKPETLQMLQVIGFLLMMGILAFVFYNDIRSLT
ncbi:RIP metalloprotease RseP [Mucilaginibacter sp. Bleaf8]|uniref:RIP metalloprotease RseP n=1 Tax=Mucilaginibacter sp. Bleaf8 TaxID=2834430 RepID=UPI001BD16334|nr:RIP metalloprotease RseP [Mucilaginibacter sp. Bleaf8]MBS7566853.1 RIP metalloprotease RseP [Mucilaginibacter sp. Bleaf8]